MADTSDPIGVDAIKLLLDNGSELGETLTKLITAAGQFADGNIKIGESLDNLSKKLESTNSNIDKVTNSATLFSRANINMLATTEALTVKMGGASAAFAAFNNEVNQGTSSIKDSFDELGKFGSGIEATFNKIAAAGGGLGKVAGSLGKSFMEAFRATERVQDMERGFISLGAVTGNLGDVFDKTGRMTGQFDGNIAQFTKNMIDASTATGIGVGKITQAAKELGQIPGALQTVVQTGAGGASELVAVTQIAAATGKDLKVVIGEMSAAYKDLGLSGQKAIDYLSTVAATSSELNLPLDVTTNSINNLSKAYAFLTNNTDGAVRAFGKFVPALQDVGLSPQQATAMFDEMSSSIKQLDVGTKAFLAQRSGVGSGLQGAFKIDKLVKDGKIDEVMNMMQKNLQRQIGGNVVTLDQAAESQQAASQYQRQLAYLKSSAFGSMLGKGPDADDKASKLFEAMKTGSLTKDAKEAITGQAATNQITTRGSSVQSRMSTVVSAMATDVQRMAANEDRILAFMVRRFGGASPDSPVRSMLEENMMQGRNETAKVDKMHYQDPTNTSVEVGKHLSGMFNKLQNGYLGEKDMFGKQVAAPSKVPAPRGASVPAPNLNDKAFQLSGLTPQGQPMRDAVKQNINQTRTTSAIQPGTLSAATKTAQSQQSSPQSTSGEVHVKGTIEGFCLNCKETMDVGHFNKAVTAATNSAATDAQNRRGSPAKQR